MQTKTCIKCGEKKPLTSKYFHERKDSKDGYRNNCKECSVKWKKNYYDENQERPCRICNSSKNNADFFEWYPTYGHYSKNREKQILRYLGYKDENIQQLSIL